MNDEGQEKVRQMRELLAKSQAPKAKTEHERQVIADRGGIAVNAGGSVHIGIGPVVQRKPFFNFGRLLGAYLLLFFGVYVGLRLVPLWQSQRGQPPLHTLIYVSDQVPLGELLVIFIATTAIAAGLAALTRWALRG